MILGVILLSILFSVIFSYIFWKRLKDDYVPEHIFTTEVYVGIGILLAIVIRHFYPKYWVESAFILAALFCLIGIRRFKMRWNEVLDGLIIALLPGANFYYLVDSVSTRSIESVVMWGTTLLLFFAYFLIDKRYKSFSFYPSGKIGFSGFFVLGVFSIVGLIVAIIGTDMITFNTSLESLFSGISAIVSIVIIVLLSRKS